MINGDMPHGGLQVAAEKVAGNVYLRLVAFLLPPVIVLAMSIASFFVAGWMARVERSMDRIPSLSESFISLSGRVDNLNGIVNERTADRFTASRAISEITRLDQHNRSQDARISRNETRLDALTGR